MLAFPTAAAAKCSRTAADSVGKRLFASLSNVCNISLDATRVCTRGVAIASPCPDGENGPATGASAMAMANVSTLPLPLPLPLPLVVVVVVVVVVAVVVVEERARREEVGQLHIRAPT